MPSLPLSSTDLPLLIATLLLMSGCSPCSDSRHETAQEPAVTTNAPSTTETTTGPVCSLSPKELNARRQELLPGLIKRADQVTDIDDGLALRFASRPGLMTELCTIVEMERTCCSFLKFSIEVAAHGGAITFTVSGPKGTRDMLRAL